MGCAMKRISTFLLLLVVLFGAFVEAAAAGPERLPEEPNNPEQDLHAKEKQARQLAEEVLQGRPIAVRIYDDWQVDPRAHKLVSVRLTGLSLGMDSVESTAGRISKSAVIVVLGQDQKDAVVKALLADTVFARAYGQAESIYLWPPFLQDPGDKWWVFNDALGAPIPDAAVDVRILDCNNGAYVSLGKFSLDDQGRLRRLTRINPLSKFVFLVSHADYGVAEVEVGSCPSVDRAPMNYVVPLVAMDSEAGSRAVYGFVKDMQGNPVAEAEIKCQGLRAPDADRIRLHSATIARALTDEQGWFAMYAPVAKDDRLTTTLIPRTARYHLNITPPKPLNLRQYNGRIVSGKEVSIKLTALHADEYFHTFAFEYAEGPVTDPEELAKINVELRRDGKNWLTLSYDDIKAGTHLPLGKLYASTSRWGDRFNFKPLELIADSPEQLVLRPRREIVYRGQVVNGLTGEAMPNVLVLADHEFMRKPLDSLETEELEQLHTEAAEELSAGPGDRRLYDYRTRVTLTDANGCYELVFMPGFRTRLWQFAALEKGFVGKSVHAGQLSPDEEGIVELPAIKLSPPGPEYLPTLVFEDESGRVTDPEMLDKVEIKVVKPGGGSWHLRTYKRWPKIARFVPGTYYATADWHGKRYIFEPVDLTEKRPETVVFKTDRIEPGQILYQGQVVHGVTGRPVAGAVVMDWKSSGYADASGLAAEQWDAIHSLGPQLDPNDPALVPLREIFQFTRVMQTGADGWFQIRLANRTNRGHGALVAVQKDFVGALQQFEYSVPGATDDRGRPIYKEFELDENGYTTLPAMKLFPAGTILVEPSAPDFVRDQRHQMRISWRTSPEDKTAWRKGLFATPADNRGGKVLHKYRLQPNQMQSVYIPAEVELAVEIYRLGDERWAPIVIDGVRLRQGQVLELGRQDFKPTVKVSVKVVDRTGEPVAGARVCWAQADSPSGYGYSGSATDGRGIASVAAPPHSSGRLVVVHFDKDTKERFTEDIPCEVRGPQDAGREFRLQVSDAMLSHLVK